MPLKCILAGAGGQGRNWLNQVKNHPEYELVAVAEPFAANREKAVADFKLAPSMMFDSLDAAIVKTKADFVLDVTPPSEHAKVAEKAFAAGLHVLGEKPLSDDFAAAKRVVELGKKAGRKHMITQNYRFGACPRTSRKALADGIIGKPGQCDVRFYMPWADFAGSHYVTQPYMLINDMMVHHFDMIRYVLGVDPVAVTAITWNHSWGWHKGDAAHAIVFEFDGGLHATHVSIGCSIGQTTSWNGDWRIEGEKGSLSWENDRMWHVHLHRAPKPVREEVFPIPMPGGNLILAEFAAAIRENREPECNAADNIKSVAMVFAAIKSTKEKRRVALSEL